MYRLRVVVDEIRGFCDLPMSKGDYFEVDGGRLLIPPGKHMCIWALQSLMPFLTAKQRNVVEENDWLPSTSRIMCPDPNGMVVYRVIRVGVDDVAAPNVGAPAGSEPSPPAEHGPVLAVLERAGGVATEGAIPERILVSPGACSGCRRCELACSLRHENSFHPEMSRIMVAKDESLGSDIPQVCRQCGTARCLQACPSEAISRDPVTHAIRVDRSHCVKCGACSRACPFGGIRMPGGAAGARVNGGYPLVCDLCGGNPACAAICPTGAVRWGRAGDEPPRPRFSQPGKERPGKRSSKGCPHARISREGD